MIFTPSAIPGVYLIDLERHEDDRGFFARSWCREEFSSHGLVAEIAQCSVSYNRRCGTLRGMHYQVAPHQEAKVVRCTRGRIYDVALDLRADTSTFRHWVAVELTAANRRMLYLPPAVAHGFQTLEDETEVIYQMSESYHPEAARGVRWDDPAFGITWPLANPVLSEKDRSYPNFQGVDR